MLPDHFVGRRVGIDFALEVHVVTLLDVRRIHVGSQSQFQ